MQTATWVLQSSAQPQGITISSLTTMFIYYKTHKMCKNNNQKKSWFVYWISSGQNKFKNSIVKLLESFPLTTLPACRVSSSPEPLLLYELL